MIKELGLLYGKGKNKIVKIPEIILRNWDLLRHTIRGIMDTDGTVFVSEKPRVKEYPTMEITKTSKFLAKQIERALLGGI